MKYILYNRCLSEINEFKRGLEAVGRLWTRIVKKPKTYEILFTRREQYTAKQLKTITKWSFSDEGSNRRVEEEETMFFFENFVKNCEGEFLFLYLVSRD